ncbi:MAG: hypothetical protein EBT93_11765, partial [Alphaproteobacteria bacterium]|nr:hypothetical protein [Alphaproteobacteria bacterium]
MSASEHDDGKRLLMTTVSPLSSIIEQRDCILADIEAAAKADGRGADDVTLIAVSKKQPDDRIDAALE